MPLLGGYYQHSPKDKQKPETVTVRDGVQNGASPRLQDAALRRGAVNVQAVDAVVNRVVVEDSQVAGHWKGNSKGLQLVLVSTCMMSSASPSLSQTRD